MDCHLCCRWNAETEDAGCRKKAGVPVVRRRQGEQNLSVGSVLA
jgi:hypothetical protein